MSSFTHLIDPDSKTLLPPDALVLTLLGHRMGYRSRAADGSRVGKNLLFVNKKKQKNFIHLHRA